MGRFIILSGLISNTKRLLTTLSRAVGFWVRVPGRRPPPPLFNFGMRLDYAFKHSCRTRKLSIKTTNEHRPPSATVSAKLAYIYMYLVDSQNLGTPPPKKIDPHVLQSLLEGPTKKSTSNLGEPLCLHTPQRLH